MQKKYRRGSADQGDHIHKNQASTNQNNSQKSLMNDFYSAEYSTENHIKEPTTLNNSPAKGAGVEGFFENMEAEINVPPPQTLSKLRSEDP